MSQLVDMPVIARARRSFVASTSSIEEVDPAPTTEDSGHPERADLWCERAQKVKPFIRASGSVSTALDVEKEEASRWDTSDVQVGISGGYRSGMLAPLLQVGPTANVEVAISGCFSSGLFYPLQSGLMFGSIIQWGGSPSISVTTTVSPPPWPPRLWNLTGTPTSSGIVWAEVGAQGCLESLVIERSEGELVALPLTSFSVPVEPESLEGMQGCLDPLVIEWSEDEFVASRAVREFCANLSWPNADH